MSGSVEPVLGPADPVERLEPVVAVDAPFELDAAVAAGVLIGLVVAAAAAASERGAVSVAAYPDAAAVAVVAVVDAAASSQTVVAGSVYTLEVHPLA